MIKRVQGNKVETKTQTDESFEEKLTEKQLVWWNDIKGIKIDIFGFTGKEAGYFLKPLNMSEDSLFLLSKAPAVAPALESSLNMFTAVESDSKLSYPKYAISTEDKYIVIKPNKPVVNKDFEGKSFLVLE